MLRALLKPFRRHWSRSLNYDKTVDVELSSAKRLLVRLWSGYAHMPYWKDVRECPNALPPCSRAAAWLYFSSVALCLSWWNVSFGPRRLLLWVVLKRLICFKASKQCVLPSESPFPRRSRAVRRWQKFRFQLPGPKKSKSATQKPPGATFQCPGNFCFLWFFAMFIERSDLKIL